MNAPNRDTVVADYAAGSANDLLPQPNPQWDVYRKLYETGILKAIGAFDGNNLVGFVSVLIAVLPKNGMVVANTESLFVLDEYRKAGLGLRLISAAEELAKDMGAIGLIVNAHPGSKLETILNRKKSYSEINRVFFKPLE